MKANGCKPPYLIYSYRKTKIEPFGEDVKINIVDKRLPKGAVYLTKIPPNL